MEVIATNPNVWLTSTSPSTLAAGHGALGLISSREAGYAPWLLDRLSYPSSIPTARMNDAGTATARLGMALTSVVRLADVARQDPEFHQVGELYRDDPAFDIAGLVAELVEAESVPSLPVLRYKPSSLRKLAERG